MPGPTYQPGIPTGTVPLNQDYLNLQNNFTALNNSFGIDHLPFADTSTENGFHTVVHLLNQTSTPTDNTASGQIYAFNDASTIPSGGDSQLYYKSPNTVGNGVQISGNSALSNGYGWFSGILQQWGSAVNPGSGTQGTVTFPVAFPNNCFVIFTQIHGNTSNTGTIAVYNESVTSFNFKCSFSFSTASAFFWTAIGN